VAARDTARRASPTPPPRTPPASQPNRAARSQDSALTINRFASALDARNRALAAGATAAELYMGDSHRDAAEQLMRAGRFTDAAARIGDAVTQWGTAERRAADRLAAASRPAPSPPPPVRVDTPSTPSPAPPSAAMIRQQITDAVLAYGRALETRNIASIRLAYPGLTSQQERGWRDFFQVAQDLHVSLGVTDVQQSVDAAEATVTGAFEYRNTQSRRQERQPVSFRATLERGGGGWRITQIR
jgi:hypothetical protein